MGYGAITASSTFSLPVCGFFYVWSVFLFVWWCGGPSGTSMSFSFDGSKSIEWLVYSIFRPTIFIYQNKYLQMFQVCLSDQHAWYFDLLFYFQHLNNPMIFMVKSTYYLNLYMLILFLSVLKQYSSPKHPSYCLVGPCLLPFCIPSCSTEYVILNGCYFCAWKFGPGGFKCWKIGCSLLLFLQCLSIVQYF